MKVVVVVVGLLSIAVHSSDAVFTSDVLRSIQRGFLPDGLDLQNTVNCLADDGKTFDVPLVAARQSDGSLRYVPQTPDYIRVPEALECVNTNAEVLEALVQILDRPNLNLTLQKLSEAEANEEFENLMANDVLSFCRRFYDEDGDIDSPRTIVTEAIVTVTNQSGLSGLQITPDNQNMNANTLQQLQDLFDALRCRPNYQFTDLGPAFLPRFMIAGSCFPRACSFPIEEGQLCRADTNMVGRLPGLRYDCCWIQDMESREDPTKLPELEFRCGWRQVNLPILCDCDCACDMAA